MGSEGIDSGEESQSSEDEGSDSEDGRVSPSGKQGNAEGSEEEEDEVGDLSWEAVMAAVQGGGSDDNDEDGQDEPKAVTAAGHAEPKPLPLKTVQSKSGKSFRAAAGGKHRQISKQTPSQLGKRSRKE